MFSLLSLLMAVEASTSIARKSGYAINSPASGFVFQNSLSLLSRVLVFAFMPLLGYLSDTNSLNIGGLNLILLFALTPLLLVVTYLSRFKLEQLFTVLLLRINSHGTFFRRTNERVSIKKTNKSFLGRFNKLYVFFVLAYIPFYLAWPTTIILMTEFNDYRATILGLSSIFNGINTIFITVFLDPKLTQLGKYLRIINSIYVDLIMLRVMAALFSLLLVSLYVFVLL